MFSAILPVAPSDFMWFNKLSIWLAQIYYILHNITVWFTFNKLFLVAVYYFKYEATQHTIMQAIKMFYLWIRLYTPETQSLVTLLKYFSIKLSKHVTINVTQRLALHITRTINAQIWTYNIQAHFLLLLYCTTRRV